jgi:apolipoprotein N-acyltransferase
LLAPALLLWSLQAQRRPSPWRAAKLGLTCGFVCNAIALYWVVGLLRRFASFPLAAAVPTAMLLWLAQGLILALAAAGAVALARRGAPLWLALPACLTVSYSLMPAVFPWRPAATQLPWLAWVQVAELGGEPLLDLLWALAGCSALQAVQHTRRRTAAALVAAGALLVPALYGTVRLPQVHELRGKAPSLAVGVVQPNIGIFEKHDPRLRESHLRRLRHMTRDLEAQGADLVVWPETAYPYRLHRDRRHAPAGYRALRTQGVDGPLLFGALTVRGECERWNSAVAMSDDGRIVGIADKVRLLAFGEYVPLWHWLPPLQESFRCPGLVAGKEPPVVEVAGARVGVLNCYEDILGGFAQAVYRADPELLANVTNDAWFGDSSEPHLHHQLARLRSIESRRDLVRAVNTGVSGHVSATGADLQRTETWQRDSFVAQARLMETTTPWTRYGDLVTPILYGLLLGLAWTYGRADAGKRQGPAHALRRRLR